MTGEESSTLGRRNASCSILTFPDSCCSVIFVNTFTDERTGEDVGETHAREVWVWLLGDLKRSELCPAWRNDESIK